MPPSNIRVRFAPSPTGDPHLGSMWIAMFNKLFAEQHGGKFILRVEDTDRKRFVPGSVEKIYEALEWFGLPPDEGPQQGGKFGPYVQSERTSLYQHYADQLLASGKAYRCFCTAERLEEVRAARIAAKQAPRYDKHCATLDNKEVDKRIAAGESFVIRLNMPEHGTIQHHDIIRGDVTFSYDQSDDQVLMKSDGFPTYHLANVVDDHLMEISHVIRAEEWLPSIPKHLYLYQAFGWEPPQFAHLPMILGADRSKLSKRHAATSALSYRDEGYLPEAMRNFMVLMGWHPKGEEEIFDWQLMLKLFKLEDMSPSGAVFDRTKLDWMNGVYIRLLDDTELLKRLKPFWNIPTAEKFNDKQLNDIMTLVKERLVKLSDINDMSNFMFPTVWDVEQKTFDVSLLVPKKGNQEQAVKDLTWAYEWLGSQPEPWKASILKTAMLEAIKSADKKNGDVLWPLRVALSLRTASPDVFDLLAVLGLSESQRRITSFL